MVKLKSQELALHMYLETNKKRKVGGKEGSKGDREKKKD